MAISPGELIPLWGDMTFEYIKGHVSFEEAQAVLDKEFADKKVNSIEHRFAFWGVGLDDSGEPAQIFYVRHVPGRGRFKVTEIAWSEK